MAGIVGSLVYRWNHGRFLRPYKAALLMLLYSGFDMFLITILTTKPDGVIIANALYAPMTFGAVLGMLLFTLFLDEKKEEAEVNGESKQTEDNSGKISVNGNADTNAKIIEISQELNEYKNKTDESKRELKAYKDKVDDLERELDEIKKKLG